MSQDSGAAHGAPRPTFTSLIANVAVSAAMHRSQHWASRNPPAHATPFTAAIVGLATSRAGNLTATPALHSGGPGSYSSTLVNRQSLAYKLRAEHAGHYHNVAEPF